MPSTFCFSNSGASISGVNSSVPFPVLTQRMVLRKWDDWDVHASRPTNNSVKKISTRKTTAKFLGQ